MKLKEFYTALLCVPRVVLATIRNKENVKKKRVSRFLQVAVEMFARASDWN